MTRSTEGVARFGRARRGNELAWAHPAYADARAVEMLSVLAARIDELHTAVAALSARGSVATAPNEPERLLTMQETIALLRVSARTFRRLRHQKRAPMPIRFGTSLRWRLRDVNRWLERQT